MALTVALSGVDVARAAESPRDRRPSSVAPSPRRRSPPRTGRASVSSASRSRRRPRVILRKIPRSEGPRQLARSRRSRVRRRASRPPAHATRWSGKARRARSAPATSRPDGQRAGPHAGRHEAEARQRRLGAPHALQPASARGEAALLLELGRLRPSTCRSRTSSFPTRTDGSSTCGSAWR